MLFTAAETRAFFEDADQMEVQTATMAQLRNEGIVEVVDLSDFDSDSLK